MVAGEETEGDPAGELAQLLVMADGPQLCTGQALFLSWTVNIKAKKKRKIERLMCLKNYK